MTPYVGISKYLLTPRVNLHDMTEAVQGNRSVVTVRDSTEPRESKIHMIRGVLTHV